MSFVSSGKSSSALLREDFLDRLTRIETTLGGVPLPPGLDDGTLPSVHTDDDLDQAIYRYFGVALPRTVIVPGHRTPHEFVHDSFFARFPVTIAKASRGLGGKTFTFAILALCEALFLKANVAALGGSGDQSQRMLENMADLWDSPSAPTAYLKGPVGTKKQRFIWGNTIRALTASQRSVRGLHPQRLRLDEIDEMDWNILQAALGQPQSKLGVLSQVAMGSTHQYPDGTFTKALREAAVREGWKVYEWSYRETVEPHGWLTQAEVERKQSVMTVAHWRTEVELQEPTAEGRAFDTASIERAFRKDLTLAGKVEGGSYGHGADWAKKVNWTFIVSILKNPPNPDELPSVPKRVVAVKRAQREPWPRMVKYLDEAFATYGGQAHNNTSVHDMTGLGQVIDDLLTHPSEGFNMVGQARAELLSDYIAAVEHGDIIWPRDDDNPALAQAYSEHKYASREDIYKGSKDGTTKHHLPDSVSAAAFAWRAAKSAAAVGASLETPDVLPDLQPGRVSRDIFGSNTRGDYRPMFNRRRK